MLQKKAVFVYLDESNWQLSAADIQIQDQTSCQPRRQPRKYTLRSEKKLVYGETLSACLVSKHISHLACALCLSISDVGRFHQRSGWRWYRKFCITLLPLGKSINKARVLEPGLGQLVRLLFAILAARAHALAMESNTRMFYQNPSKRSQGHRGLIMHMESPNFE